jgi:hypothetical protein
LIGWLVGWLTKSKDTAQANGFFSLPGFRSIGLAWSGTIKIFLSSDSSDMAMEEKELDMESAGDGPGVRGGFIVRLHS